MNVLLLLIKACGSKDTNWIVAHLSFHWLDLIIATLLDRLQVLLLFIVTPHCIIFLLQACLLLCPPSSEQQHPPRASLFQQWWGLIVEWWRGLCTYLQGRQGWAVKQERTAYLKIELGRRLACATSSDKYSVLSLHEEFSLACSVNIFYPLMRSICFSAWYADNDGKSSSPSNLVWLIVCYHFVLNRLFAACCNVNNAIYHGTPSPLSWVWYGAPSRECLVCRAFDVLVQLMYCPYCTMYNAYCTIRTAECYGWP